MESVPCRDNRLLRALQRHCPALRRVGTLLAVPAGVELGRDEDVVLFPLSGLLSLRLARSMPRADEGTGADKGMGGRRRSCPVDIDLVANDGMAGIGAWLGVGPTLENIVALTPAAVLRIPARTFADRVTRHRAGRRLMDRLVAYRLRCSYQNVVCAAHHSVEQRTCRWLLWTADRAGDAPIALTQAGLARLLGVRRQSVGETALMLQQAASIHYTRQRIVVADRKALLDRSCACYHTLCEAFRQIVEPLL